MKKKIVVGLLSFVMITSTSGVCFAENIDGEQGAAEVVADEVECITGTEDINQNIEETEEGFVVEGETTDVTIPEDGDGAVVMDSGEEIIEMELPEEVEGKEGKLTDNGTVVYGADEDVSVSIQAVEQTDDDMIYSGTRALINIADSSAPREYSFDYDVPAGYKLIKSKEDGSVFVVNEQNESTTVIAPAWAKDAEGNNIDTYYKVDGNKLIQVVNFDENSSFPIVADPTTLTVVKTWTKVLKTYNQKLGQWVMSKGVIEQRKGLDKGSKAWRYWNYSVTSSKSVQVGAGISGKYVSMDVAYTTNCGQSTGFGEPIPNTGKWYKMWYWEEWELKHKARFIKYKVTKITNNGKNKEISYKTVQGNDWVEKYRYTGKSDVKLYLA